MATRRDETATQAPVSTDEFAKYTYNVRGFNESLTIRCDSEEELQQLRDKWSVVINPPRRRVPYMHSGDQCLVADCGGFMIARTGTNRKTQQPYRFLKCSKNPASCSFFAYIETEQNTPEQNGNGQPTQPALQTTELGPNPLEGTPKQKIKVE